MSDEDKKAISPYVRLDRKYKESMTRLVGILMQRHLLPGGDADYVLEPLGEKAVKANSGMTFYDEKGNRLP